MGLCFSNPSFSQSSPLSSPRSIEYPGIIQTFEKLIKIDQEKFNNRFSTLQKNGKTLADINAIASVKLETDFLNSVILHSDSSYIKLASVSLCRFYETVLTDLLKSSEGKIKNVLVNYVDREGKSDSVVMLKKDFLTKVVNQECPDVKVMIDKFQIKNLDKTLKSIDFEIPAGKEHCENIHLSWVNNPNSPYLCQIHEYMKEARAGEGDPKDLIQRQGIASLLEKKLSPSQKDYLNNLCPNLDDKNHFCEDFLNVSFWSKVASGQVSDIYAEDICLGVTGTPNLSDNQIRMCASRLKKENDLCLYPAGKSIGLLPQPDCDSLSLALNYSLLRSDYKDCPGSSDQQGVINISRVLLNITKESIQSYEGQCSSIAAGMASDFNKKFDNEENWKLEACYDDRLKEREICFKTYFGAYGTQPEAYPNVVENILQLSRGADKSVQCQMVDSLDYNPLLLKFKSGCYIIYDRARCQMSQCKHKILYNDRTIDFIKIKNRLTLDYFPLSVKDERFSQHFLLTRDFKQNGKVLNNLSNIQAFFKKSKKGIIHGMGCAEDLLPSFFKMKAMNQCSALPFIVDGVVKDGDQTVFVTRTALDTLQAPRLISWSTMYSSVKSYQKHHPLKMWTLYGLD
jgi:hypothetical protein